MMNLGWYLPFSIFSLKKENFPLFFIFLFHLSSISLNFLCNVILFFLSFSHYLFASNSSYGFANFLVYSSYNLPSAFSSIFALPLTLSIPLVFHSNLYSSIFLHTFILFPEIPSFLLPSLPSLLPTRMCTRVILWAPPWHPAHTIS